MPRCASRCGRALRLEGYEVELAADGAEALERLESDGAGVDLVVLDVLMPNVDGLEVCGGSGGAAAACRC